MNNNLIAENIKKIRKEKGFTQKELALRSGITRESIGNYERGDRTPPADILTSIAKALDVTTHELMTGESLFDGNGRLKKTFLDAANLYSSVVFNSISNTTDSELEETVNRVITRLEYSDFNTSDIEEKFHTTIIELILLADKSKEIKYSFNDFNESELNEISNFVFNSYKLKVNEILERHKKEALLLNKGVQIAKSKLSQKDLSHIERLSLEEQSDFWNEANEIAKKIIKERSKEK